VGIDIGSKIEIYRFINDLAEKGAAILLISSELPEVHRLAHRIYVMRDGRIVDEFKGSETTEKTLLSSFFGVEA
jgi:ribose transport system ATP-binding protein